MTSYKVTKSSSKSSGKKPKSSQPKRPPPPRQDSPNANDPRNITSYHPDQAQWSWTNLPTILYQLSPKEKDVRLKDPGNLSYPIHGKYLRSLPVLPDNISSTVEEFRVEAWQRMDERIYLEDITDRMHPDFRIKNNALQQRGVRFRQAFNILAWRSGNKRSVHLEAKLLQRMDALGLDINSNSTRGITPGLINPEFGEAGGRVPIPDGWRARKLGLEEDKPKSIEDLTSEPEVRSKDLEVFPKRPELVPTDPKVSLKEPVVLPNVPEISVLDADVIEHIHEFANYDEYDKHPDGALPIIRGLIPDEKLPATVSMDGLDLSMGYCQPAPEVKLENESTPIIPNPDRVQWRPNYWAPRCTISIYGFCNLGHLQTLQPPDEFLDCFPPVSAPPSKPQTPSTGIFPISNPIKLDMIPLEEQKNVFDDMLAEYYKGERQLTEMPYISV
ncbi:hypothetical protein BJX76DRAFT_353621 [Aspergillus varians]